MFRVVLDTNVFVSHLLVKESLPARVVDAWRERRYLLLISPPLIAEIAATLRYPRIRDRYNLTKDDVEGLLDLLEKDAILATGEVDVRGAIPDDPSDEMVLACALEGGADLIVSGDILLLDLAEYEGIPILTVRQFFDRLEIEEPS